MPTTQELVEALRRIEHAPNQGDRGIMGRVADAAYKADDAISTFGTGKPSMVGGVASRLLGVPAVAATADSLSRGLPVEPWQAAEAALAPLTVYQLGGLGVKGVRGLADALRK